MRKNSPASRCSSPPEIPHAQPPPAIKASTCPRCGCDLTKSAAAHAIARRHTIAAAARLREGDSEHALEHAAYAWSLAQLPAIPPLACLAALHARDITELALWRSRASRPFP